MPKLNPVHNFQIPQLVEGDSVYHSQIAPNGWIQHLASNTKTGVLSTYHCTAAGNFIMREENLSTPPKYRNKFHRLAVSISTICAGLVIGVVCIGIAKEGVGALNFQNSMAILGILGITSLVPMGIYHGVSWIVKGFKGK